jgi:hypothetical protein
VRPVLGDHRGDLGQLDHLAGGELAGGALVEGGAATLAAGGPVVDDLVGGGRHLQPLALGPPLLAPPPLRPSALGLGAPQALLGLALALGGRVTRRRPPRVPRVLVQLALQLGDPCLEALDHLALGLDELDELRVLVDQLPVPADDLRLPDDQSLELGDATLVLLRRGRVACHVRNFATTPRDSCLQRWNFRGRFSSGRRHT